MYLGHCVFNHLLVFHIALVTDQELIDPFGCVAVDFLQPLLDVVEGIHVGHIVYDTDAMCATVVGRGDSSKAFLASSIPLQYGSAPVFNHCCQYAMRHVRFAA